MNCRSLVVQASREMAQYYFASEGEEFSHESIFFGACSRTACDVVSLHTTLMKMAETS
jgi:hypothetical protein